MTARRPNKPRPVPTLSLPRVAAPDTKSFDVSDAIQRAMQESEQAFRARELEGRLILEASLAIGRNKISHGLGRAPQFVLIQPTVASASFGWAVNLVDNPAPELQVWIDIIGADQPRAKVWVF